MAAAVSHFPRTDETWMRATDDYPFSRFGDASRRSGQRSYVFPLRGLSIFLSWEKHAESIFHAFMHPAAASSPSIFTDTFRRGGGENFQFRRIQPRMLSNRGALFTSSVVFVFVFASDAR